MKYIEEYIPKLHIHQHSLLTRKVLFRHNFFSTGLLLCITGSCSSSSHLCHQVFFIFKSSGSGSSLDLDHHRTSSQDLDHHSIWIIITESRSSLDLDHLSGQDLDHLSIWIITAGSGSSLDLDLSESS